MANPFARAINGAKPLDLKRGDSDTLEFLAGNYAQRQLTSTILVLKNTMDWMTGDALVACTLAPPPR